MLISSVFWLYFRRAYRSSKGRHFFSAGNVVIRWPCELLAVSSEHWEWDMKNEVWGRSTRLRPWLILLPLFKFSIIHLFYFFVICAECILWILHFLLWKCIVLFCLCHLCRLQHSLAALHVIFSEDSCSIRTKLLLSSKHWFLIITPFF